MRDLESTIVAVATPIAARRELSRGIVRTSGDAALRVIGAGLHWRQGAPERGVGSALLPMSGSLLPVLAMRFPGPRSFTGEDVLELQVPGSPELLERIVSSLIAIGAAGGASVRRAEAGEFSARAFLRGRIGLDEAEGIAAAIAARGDGELRAARRTMEGRLGALVRSWTDRLVELLALLEAGIDFTDQEDVITISRRGLVAILAPVIVEIEQELRGSAPREARRALPRVVLTGPPNAGKSSLFNALLGVDRSIVAALAGTTRDAIEMPLAMDRSGAVVSGEAVETEAGGAREERDGLTRPIEVLLVDIPGVEDVDAGASDPRSSVLPFEDLEEAMVASARTAISGADLLLRCIPADGATRDASPEPSTSSGARSESAPHEIRVVTRVDLVPRARCAAEKRVILTSSRTGEGVVELRRAIVEAVCAEIPLDADASALDGRHRAALSAGLEELLGVRAGVDDADAPDDPPEEPELLVARLRGAVDALGEITGRVIADDVLEIVFRRFCIGK